MVPKVSVVIPVYNVEKYLARCLDSLVNQTLRPVEIICVDDGSTDASPEILARYAAAHPQLCVRRQANAGQSAARNAGLDLARGEYVYFVDSDDVVLGDDALEKMYRRASENRADILTFGCELEYETDALRATNRSGAQYMRLERAYPDGLSGRELFVRLVDGDDYFCCPPVHLLRRDFLRERKLRFVEGILFEDQLFMIQCFSMAARTAVLNESLYLYFIREGSTMTGMRLRDNARNHYRIAALMRNFYREQITDGTRAFRKRYFRWITAMSKLGTQSLCALPRAERGALWRSLSAGERSVARADLARLPWRKLDRRLRRCVRRLRRALKRNRGRTAEGS